MGTLMSYDQMNNAIVLFKLNFFTLAINTFP